MKPSEALAVYLSAKSAENLRPATLTSYRVTIGKFTDYCAEQGVGAIADLEPLHVRGFISRELRAGMKPNSVRTERIILVCWLSWLADEGHIARNDWTKAVRSVKADRAMPVFLSNEETARLLKAAAGMECRLKFCAARNQAVISLLLDTGCRKSEFLNIRLSEVDLDKRQITLMETKGRRPRMVFFGERTEQLLRAYLVARAERFPNDSGGWLWLNRDGEQWQKTALYNLVRKLGEAIGRPELHPHSVRHTAATSCLRNGMPVAFVRELMGHADLATTQRYLHLLPVDVQARYKTACPVDMVLAAG